MLSGKIITTIKKQSNRVIEQLSTLEEAVRGSTSDQSGSISSTNSSLSSFIATFNSWRSSWTSSRAGKLDYLDYSISSVNRAVSDKASQSSVDGLRSYVDDLESRLTSTRASKLDNLDTNVNSRSSQSSVDELKKSLVDVRSVLVTNINQLGISATRTETIKNLIGKIQARNIPNLSSSNIKKGVNIAGVVGTCHEHNPNPTEKKHTFTPYIVNRDYSESTTFTSSAPIQEISITASDLGFVNGGNRSMMWWVGSKNATIGADYYGLQIKNIPTNTWVNIYNMINFDPPGDRTAIASLYMWISYDHLQVKFKFTGFENTTYKPGYFFGWYNPAQNGGGLRSFTISYKS